LVFQAALGLFGEQAFVARGYGFGGYFGGHFNASAFGEQFGQLGGGDKGECGFFHGFFLLGVGKRVGLC
jgi:hypothetical protein